MVQIPARGSKDSVAAIIADHNHLSTLNGIDQFPSLIQVDAITSFTIYCCKFSFVKLHVQLPLCIWQNYSLHVMLGCE